MSDPAVPHNHSSPPSTSSKPPPSTHRLPTVSATQALHDLESSGSRYISTGLPSLDALLSANGDASTGGLERTKVTELWGPKGAGKTAIALQVATNCILSGNSVIWIDLSSPLPPSRLSSTLSNSSLLKQFTHLPLPTLTHLLFLLLHPPVTLFPPATAKPTTNSPTLLILENIHIPLEIDFPRTQPPGTPKVLLNRRSALLGKLVSALGKLARSRNLAVLVTVGAVARSRQGTGTGAALAPAVGGVEWDAGIWARIVAVRDHAGVRGVGVQRVRGRNLVPFDSVGERGKVVGFEVSGPGAGVGECDYLQGQGQMRERGGKGKEVGNERKGEKKTSKKRVYDEIADSEEDVDEDEYGWEEGDEDAMASEAFRVEEEGDDDAVSVEASEERVDGAEKPDAAEKADDGEKEGDDEKLDDAEEPDDTEKPDDREGPDDE